jgi:hypothetical protein
MPTWLALVTGVGVGTLVAGVLSRWSVISNHRQKWINALRDDLVEYLKQIDSVHYIVSKGAALNGEEQILRNVDKQQEAQNAAKLVYHRILLRLNVTEKQHIELAKSLKRLLDDDGDFADPKQVENAITLARRVLKQEWAVTKYGAFTPFMLKVKAALKEMKVS